MIHIIKKGQGSTALVFFHGWGFDATIWLSLASLLEKEYTLYLVDLPGFGQTMFCSEPLFQAELQNLLPPQFVLVAWSLGGLYALSLAETLSHRISRLIMVATTPFFLQEGLWPGITRLQFHQFFEQLKRDPLSCLHHFIAAQTGGLVAWSPTLLPSQPALEKGLQMLLTADFRSRLFQMKTPMHWIFGGLDTIVPRKTCLLMKTRYPRLTITLLKKAAHMPFLSDQDSFIQLLRASI